MFLSAMLKLIYTIDWFPFFDVSRDNNPSFFISLTSDSKCEINRGVRHQWHSLPVWLFVLPSTMSSSLNRPTTFGLTITVNTNSWRFNWFLKLRCSSMRCFRFMFSLPFNFTHCYSNESRKWRWHILPSFIDLRIVPDELDNEIGVQL